LDNDKQDPKHYPKIAIVNSLATNKRAGDVASVDTASQCLLLDFTVLDSFVF
ncbi:unnamed protein product, partial [Aphanomyces euteiches]